MDLGGVVFILLLVGTLLIPTIGLAFLIRLGPIYRLSRRTKVARGLLVAGSGLLCWGLRRLVKIS